MSKETKAALKAAREAIRSKDYKEAIKQCKIVLKQDKSNYNALVFIGVAAEGLEQPDQAEAAFRKAIAIDDSQPLAWQGLCSFYEKANTDEHRNELIGAYTQLSKILEGDINRRFEVEVKLALLLKETGQVDKAAATLRQTLDAVSEDIEKSKKVQQHVVSLLAEQENLSTDNAEMLVTAYEDLLHHQSGDQDAEPAATWIQYLNFLLKRSATRDKLQEECKLMVAQLPDENFPLQLLCQIELDAYAEKLDPGVVERLLTQTSVLEKREPETVYLTLSQACQLFSKSQYREACDLLKTAVKWERSMASVWMLLGLCQVRLHDNTGVCSSMTRAQKLLSEVTPRWTGDKTKIARLSKILKAKAQIEQARPTTLSAAVEALQKLLSEGPDPAVALYLGYAYLAQGQVDKVPAVINDIEKTGDLERAHMLRGWMHFHSGDFAAAEESLSRVVKQSWQVMYQQARVYYALSANNKDYHNKCFAALLQAAKLNLYYSPTFYYLGCYYDEVVKDNVRARRCYQKAYDLDPENEEAGSALCDILSNEGEEEAAINLLMGVTQKATPGSARWAWLRLGLNQMKLGEHSASIMSLQAALRADSKDSHVWECLGDAYLSRGSYTAALKAFTKATELNPKTMYCFYQMATIQQVLGAYTEAVTQYESILENSPDYVPALKGAGETLVLQARGALNKFFHGRAIDYCEKAIQYLTRAATQRSDLSCLWKLLGDACTILYPVSKERLRIYIPMRLFSSDSSSSALVTVTKQELLALGGRCYGMGLKQVAKCPPLWHDLGISYFLQAQASSEKDGVPLVAKAMQCMQKAVSLDANNYRFWLSLGIIAASDELDNPALAQHCFIKSIKVEPNNVAAWASLGTLYLQQNQVELAHEAFKMAQSLEPLFVGSWVGQALVAEAVEHSESMDLFRHTTELDNHTEGALGYAWWVVNVLADKMRLKPELYHYTIEQMAAIPAASDVLARYTDRVKTNPMAYNLLGLLLEKQSLYKQATEAFRSAVKLLDKGPTDQLRAARSNYARLLCANGQYPESIAEYEACGAPLSFEETCGKALALYRDAQYQLSMKAYESALDMATTEEDRSHVQAALGLVAYKAGDPQMAKTLLFKCSQTTEPSVPGLLALCGLGLLEKDMTLATAVLQELDKLGHLDQHGEHILFLTVQIMAEQGSAGAGLAYIQKEIRQRPAVGPFWQCLAQYLLRYKSGGAQVAATCGQAAQRLQVASNKELSSIQSVSALAAGLHSRNDSSNDAFSFVQKAVHLHPDMVSQWCSLLGAIHAENVVRQALGKGTALEHTAMSLAAHLMAKVESELSQGKGNRQELAALHLWTVKQYIVTLLSLGRAEQAQQFLQQAMWLYDSDPALKSLAASLDQNFRGMRLALNEQQETPFLWQLLVEGLKGQGLFNEVEKTLKQWLQSSSTRPAKLVPLVQLTHLAYTRILAGVKDDKWQSLLKEASSEVLHIDPQCATVHLMLGVVHLHNNNTRQAKHNLWQALERDRRGGLAAARSAGRHHLLNYHMEKGDTDHIKTLAKDAKEDQDEQFVAFFNEVTKGSK